MKRLKGEQKTGKMVNLHLDEVTDYGFWDCACKEIFPLRVL